MQPSSGSDTTRLVHELVGEEEVEFFEKLGLKPKSLILGDTVNSMRAHDGKVRHPYFLRVSLLYQTHFGHFSIVTRVLLL